MKELFDDKTEVTVTMSLDDGTDVECRVVTVFEAGGRSYIALLPLEGPDKDSGNVWIYRYLENPDGDPELDNIDNDAEFEMALDAFDEFLDTVEFDELVEDEGDEADAGSPEVPEGTEDRV